MSLEFNLVKFPIIFPLIYGSILYLLPGFETYLIFLTILLLAETHFGATWPFFLNSANAKFIKENRISLISFPIIIATASLFGFIFLKPTFLLIFFAVNMYHVTRQSFGVCKLYTKEILQIKYQENFIYIFNFIFFLIGFFRFYFPLIGTNYVLLLNVIIIALILITLIFYYLRYGISDSFYTFVTGLIIFYPICFVANPVHAIIMGVTMHYTQYLYLTHIVFKGRREDQVIQTSKSTYLGVIAMYAIAMAILSLFGKSSNEILNFLIIIPIIGQMLHFYLDSQLWKFSKEHNRENTLKFIKTN
tara:strand:- start:647 stop:1558 length:912 start_codon:yes stop_codon:yes gene_type:complete